MAPFSVPAPRIIPLCIPVFGRPREIDTSTKIELLCDTYLKHEIFYTLDGTKPEPFKKIVQGSKTYKYFTPFCLPSGKTVIKAIAVCANIPSMYSNVITKCFVVKTSISSKNEKTVKKRKSTKSKKETVENILEGQQLRDVEPELPENIDLLICGSITDSSDEHSEIEENQPCHIFDVMKVEDSDAFDDFSKLQINDVHDKDKADEICQIQKLFFTNVKDELGEEAKTALKTEFPSQTDAEVSINEDMVKSVASIPDKLNCGEPRLCCIKCEMSVQCCVSCQKMNAVSSKYCIQCGKQLAQTCNYCNEQNLSVASFCQYCGQKLSDVLGNHMESNAKVSQTDHGVLVKPQLKHVGLQRIPMMVDKHTQTCQLMSDKKKNASRSPLKKLPPHSPGKGYWHQQLDYICNHIKTHAYNNTEFRRAISEPVLSTLESISMNKDENSVTVTIAFSPLSVDKEHINEA